MNRWTMLLLITVLFTVVIITACGIESNDGFTKDRKKSGNATSFQENLIKDDKLSELENAMLAIREKVTSEEFKDLPILHYGIRPDENKIAVILKEDSTEAKKIITDWVKNPDLIRFEIDEGAEIILE